MSNTEKEFKHFRTMEQINHWQSALFDFKKEIEDIMVNNDLGHITQIYILCEVIRDVIGQQEGDAMQERFKKFSIDEINK